MIECYMKGLEWSVGSRAHGEGRINCSGSVLPGCEGSTLSLAQDSWTRGLGGSGVAVFL